MQSGRHVARQIRRLLEGRPTTPFRYLDKGTMATIGRRAAVAELPGRIHLRGGLAWLAWLGLHLVTLVGPRNRASVLLNWAWNYLTWDRGPRIITSSGPAACPLTPPRSDPPSTPTAPPSRRATRTPTSACSPTTRGSRTRSGRRGTRATTRIAGFFDADEHDGRLDRAAPHGSGPGRGGGVRLPDAGAPDDGRRHDVRGHHRRDDLRRRRQDHLDARVLGPRRDAPRAED